MLPGYATNCDATSLNHRYSRSRAHRLEGARVPRRTAWSTANVGKHRHPDNFLFEPEPRLYGLEDAEAASLVAA
jgi:hypothetical protein